MIEIIIVLIIIAAAVSWYQGWLNKWLPDSWQHKTSPAKPTTFVAGIPSVLDPNVSCYDPNNKLAMNICGEV